MADLERFVLVVVVVGRLGPPILPGPGGLVGVELDVEGILADPLGEPVEQRDAVVSRVGADVAGDPADVAGERGEQEDRAILVVVVEELIRPHAHAEQRGSRHGGDLAGELLDRLRRGPGEVLDRLGIEVIGVLLDHVEAGAAAHGLPVGQCDFDLTLEQRLPDGREPADLVARETFGRVALSVPPDGIAPLVAQTFGDDLVAVGAGRAGRLALAQDARLVPKRCGAAAEDILGPQALEIVGAQQGRQVGPPKHVVAVVGPFAQDHVRQPEGQSGSRAGTDHDDLVTLAGRRRVLAGDHDDLGSLEARLGEPVCVGHLGADPVHAPDDAESCVLDRVEIPLDRLLARHHRVAGGEVRVPRVVVEAAASEGLVGADAADLCVEQCHRVGHAVVAEDAGHPQQGHPAAELEHLGAGAAGGLDGLLHVALGAQALHPLLAGVGLCDVLQRGRDHRRRLVVGGAHPLVTRPVEILDRGSSILAARESGLDPALEPRADPAVPDAAIAVESPRQGEPLLATAGVPPVGGAVAIEIGRLAVAHRRADADHDPGAHVGVEDAVVGIVRGAQEGELRVGMPEIAVGPLPVAAGVVRERVLDGVEGPGAAGGGGEGAESSHRHRLEKSSAGHVHGFHRFTSQVRRNATRDSISASVRAGLNVDGLSNAGIEVPGRPRRMVSNR